MLLIFFRTAHDVCEYLHRRMHLVHDRIAGLQGVACKLDGVLYTEALQRHGACVKPGEIAPNFECPWAPGAPRLSTCLSIRAAWQAHVDTGQPKKLETDAAYH